MKKLLWLLAAMGLATGAASAQTGAVTNWCVLGASQANVSGLKSINFQQGLIPACTVTVYLTGTTTKATIYADSGSGTLTNPFTAASSGQWLFYASTSASYDVVLSGGISPNTYADPVTLTGLPAGGGGGGGSNCTGTAGYLAQFTSGGCTKSPIDFGVTTSGVTTVDSPLTAQGLSVGTGIVLGLGQSGTVAITPSANQMCNWFIDTDPGAVDCITYSGNGIDISANIGTIGTAGGTLRVNSFSAGDGATIFGSGTPIATFGDTGMILNGLSADAGDCLQLGTAGIVTSSGAPCGSGGGSGTVTTVSVTSANGVSGTVANPTTTPAITLSLGAINPTSIGASTPGPITGTTGEFTSGISTGATPPTNCTGISGCGAFGEGTTAVTGSAGVDTVRAAQTSHQFLVTLNGGSEFDSLMNFSTVNLASSAPGGVAGLLPNANIANPSITINSTTCTLGGSCSPPAGSCTGCVVTSPGAGVSQPIVQQSGTTAGTSETNTSPGALGNGLLGGLLAEDSAGWDNGPSPTSAQGWSVSKWYGENYSCLSQGICQEDSFKFTKSGSGDAAARYGYATFYGNLKDYSGEGVQWEVAHANQLGFMRGTIATGGTTGTGLITTTGFGCHGYCTALSAYTGFAQGGILLDTSQGGSTAVLADLGISMGQEYYDLASGTVPVSTAWGNIVASSCTPNGTGQTPLAPTSTTCNVTLGTSPASPGNFATGYACAAGPFHEEVQITAVGTPSAGVQSVTFNTIYAWNGGTTLIMQGGPCNQALVATATASSWPVAYQVVGATSSTRVFFSNCLAGGCNNGGNVPNPVVATATVSLSRNGSGTVTATGYPYIFGSIYSFTVGTNLVVSGCSVHTDLNGTFTILTNTYDSYNAAVTWAQTGASETDNTCIVSLTPVGITFYPMAFITGNDNGVPGAANLAQNDVAFANGDTVTGSPASEFQISGHNLYISQTTPVDGSVSSHANMVDDLGPSDMQYAYGATNSTAYAAAPYAFWANGSYACVFCSAYRPANNGALLYTGGSEPVSSNAKPYFIFEDGSTSYGKLTFNPTTGVYSFAGQISAPSINALTGIQLGGSYGTAGQCPVSTGSGTAWGTCGTSGGDTITSPNSTISVGGTSSATTVDINTAKANTYTATQSFPAASIPNATLVNSSIPVNGTTCTLGTACSPPGSSSTTVAGDVTGTTGATTVVKVNGGAVPVSATGLATNGSGQPVQQTAGNIESILGITPVGTPNFTGDLATGVLADYSGNQGTGTTLLDISGANACSGAPCNGTFGGGSSTSPSWSGAALQFTGAGTGTQGVTLPTQLDAVRTLVIAMYYTPISTTPGGGVTNTNYSPILSSSTGSSGINFIYLAPCSGGAFAEPTIWSSACKTVSTNYGAGFHIFVYTLGTSSSDKDHLYIDGVEPPYSSQSYTAGAQSSGNLFLGTSNTGPWASSGGSWLMYRARFYSTELTATDALNITQIFKQIVTSEGVVTSPPSYNIAMPLFNAVGDSQTQGAGVTTPWPSLLTLTSLPSTYTIQNWGVGGITLQSMTASDQYRVGPYCSTNFGTPTIANIMGGANDFSQNTISGAAAAALPVFQNLVGEIQTLKRAGCVVFVSTLFDRGGTDEGGNTYSADNEAYNALIRQYAVASGAAGITDMGASTLIGAAGASSNGTYFQSPGSSALHVTQAGTNIEGVEASNAINYYFGTTASNPTVVTTSTYSMTAGNRFVSFQGLTTANTTFLPDCLGQTGAIYTLNNPTSNTITVKNLTSIEPINGTDYSSTGLTLTGSTNTFLDQAIGGTTAGCQWVH